MGRRMVGEGGAKSRRWTRPRQAPAPHQRRSTRGVPFLEQVEAERSVGAVVRHAIQCALRERRQRRQRGIVLDRLERALALERNLRAGIEQRLRIERLLHTSEELYRLAIPDAIEQRRAK